jgi:hypothetical protein
MSAAPPAAQELARLLLLHEAGGQSEPLALAEALERACGRLQPRMAGLIGRAGFVALFTRALRLAREAYPDLVAVAFDEQAEAGLHGAREYAAAREPAEVGDALGAILAQFIGLLITFIGEELSMRLIREIWPAPWHDAAAIAGAEAEG